jgi:hypothetical protein
VSDAEIIVDETEVVIEVGDSDAVIEVQQQDVTIEDSLSGPQGPPGPSGPPGDGSDANYVHSQTTPDDVWVISHNLGKFPAVDVVDSASTVVIGEVHYEDENSITVSFVAPFAGKAFLN